MKNMMMNLCAASLMMAGCSSASQQSEKEAAGETSDSLTMILGSYCTPEEEGIKVYTFNQTDGGFTYKSGLKGVSNPSFLSEMQGDSLIFSVAEDEGETAAAYALRYDAATCSLAVTDSARTYGASPCNITFCHKSGRVYTSNYTGGSLSVLRADKTGKLTHEKTMQFSGQGQDKVRQAAPHIHAAYFTPDGKYLWVNDLGTDRIRVMDRDTLAYTGEKDILLPAGSGPRHTCFHSSGRYAYVITELSGEVLVLDMQHIPEVKLIQTVQADTVGAQGSADIHLSPDERFLYASCRLKADGVAVFRVDAQTGMLTRVGYCPTGRHPRNFAITPNGKFMLVACRDENAVEIYEINPRTGMLSDTGKRIAMKAPVCVRWTK